MQGKAAKGSGNKNQREKYEFKIVPDGKNTSSTAYNCQDFNSNNAAERDRGTDVKRGVFRFQPLITNLATSKACLVCHQAGPASAPSFAVCESGNEDRRRKNEHGRKRNN